MLHLLLEVPRLITFFIWITVLADMIMAAAPFTQPALLDSKVFTAVINLVTGVAVISRSCPGWREARYGMSGSPGRHPPRGPGDGRGFRDRCRQTLISR
jgi:hypothetical protein